MRLILNDFVSPELKEYLLMQEGIIDIEFNQNNHLTILDIKYNEKTTPAIIMKYIELFQDNKYSILFEFDKDTISNFNVLKYVIDDMCCEYCYMGLVMDLFENEKVKSVKSNFDFRYPAFNIEFIIEFDKNYSEQELMEYIMEKYN